MTEPRITAPRLVVVVEQGDQLVEFTTQTDNRDHVRWDMTRGRKNWPTGQDAPMLWMTFLAWSALVRAGDFEGDFAKFNDVTVSISAVAVDGTPLDATDPTDPSLTVGPTQSGPAPD